MAIYRTADRNVTDLLRQVMNQHHPELLEYEVRITVLMANVATDPKTGEPKAPHALTHNGWPAQAIVKVNSHVDRVAGKADADLKIDEENWNGLTDRQREALLHHELLHLEVRCDEEGGVQTDDSGRPKLKIRPHDYDCSGFHQVAQTYREDAPEARALASLAKEWKRLDLFELLGEPETAAVG